MSDMDINSALNAMEEVFRHLYGDAAVNAAIASVLADAERGDDIPWNALSLKLKTTSQKKH